MVEGVVDRIKGGQNGSKVYITLTGKKKKKISTEERRGRIVDRDADKSKIIGVSFHVSMEQS